MTKSILLYKAEFRALLIGRAVYTILRIVLMRRSLLKGR